MISTVESPFGFVSEILPSSVERERRNSELAGKFQVLRDDEAFISSYLAYTSFFCHNFFRYPVLYARNCTLYRRLLNTAKQLVRTVLARLLVDSFSPTTTAPSRDSLFALTKEPSLYFGTMDRQFGLFQ